MLSTPSGTGGNAPAGHCRIAVQINGQGNVPATGVSTVVINLTAYHPTGTGYVTAYADKASRPTASSLNFAAGPSRGNLAVMPVGTDARSPSTTAPAPD